ncbi:hypothetical protein [Micrococcus lylae]|nr:hypothetical protein [Micrococcus lylae]
MNAASAGHARGRWRWGVAAGIVSALYPAWVASRQRPADALRS